MTWVLLAFAWAVFYAVHSVLASTRFKELLEFTPQNYRLFYNFVALSTLGLVLVVHIRSNFVSLFERQVWTDILGMALALLGFWTLFLTFRQLSIREFLGIKSETEGDLVAKGIYAHLRHPIYSGVLLLMTALLVSQPYVPNLVSLLVTIAYLPFGIRFEEQKLMAEFGKVYEAYREEIPAIFPKF